MEELTEVEKALDELKDLCYRIGWKMAIDIEKDGIHGVILGGEDYIDNIVSGEEEYDGYAVFSPEVDYGALQ